MMHCSSTFVMLPWMVMCSRVRSSHVQRVIWLSLTLQMEIHLTTHVQIEPSVSRVPLYRIRWKIQVLLAANRELLSWRLSLWLQWWLHPGPNKRTWFKYHYHDWWGWGHHYDGWWWQRSGFPVPLGISHLYLPFCGLRRSLSSVILQSINIYVWKG